MIIAAVVIYVLLGISTAHIVDRIDVAMQWDARLGTVEAGAMVLMWPALWALAAVAGVFWILGRLSGVRDK